MDGQDKVTYNHFDSYPTGLGCEVMRAIKYMNMDDITKKKIGDIVLVQEGEEVSPSIKAKIKNRIKPNLNVSLRSEDDVYCLMRNAQGKLDRYLEIGVMIDSSSFLLDSLFCEWAYIANIDTGKLEVYRGFNKKPAVGRYGNILESKPSHREAEYYGVALIAEIPFEKIRILSLELIEQLCSRIENAVDYDENHEEYPDDFGPEATGMKEFVADYS